MPSAMQTANFGFLDRYDPALPQIGALAERYFPDDPVTSIMKTRQLCELLAQEVAARVGAFQIGRGEAQVDLLGRLARDFQLPKEALQFFHFVRKVGNAANHERKGDHATALSALKVAWQLAVWFHRSFGNRQFKSGPFQPPTAPEDPTMAIREELNRLRQERDESLTAAEIATRRAAEAEVGRLTAEERSAKEAEERAFWEAYAADAEARATARLEMVQTHAAELPETARRQRQSAYEQAASYIVLDEPATRSLIDSQLRTRGWEADSVNLRYSKGARPSKGRNVAIAEWPTTTGPADYALFIGTMCVGVIEAKRANKNVSASIDQAGRYAQGFESKGVELVPGGPWRAERSTSKDAPPFMVPFLFSTNGRPYLKQLETQSGIWFRDVRDPTNIRRARVDWPTPDDVLEIIGTDRAKAHAELESMPFDFGFELRDYQENAIKAVEQTIYDDGKRSMLLAMATGTGKTKISIAMLYRLLTSKRFRRVCFVVDRRSLGEQAQGEFKTTRVIPARTFADIFGIKELSEAKPDPDTKIHVCTIQGLVKRVLFAQNPEDVPPVDQYDLMVVDECHRGYLLDRELSDAELAFRSEADYVSKYRRVLEHFDSVKIGLTATPALHTTEIFGEPIYTYSYREAVADGWLCDQDPPYHIRTALSQEGIHFRQGESLPLLDPLTGKVDLTNAPDDLAFDVGEFNKKVITREFNRVVAGQLAEHIDPSLPGKTLVFATTDGHADIIVDELKKAFAAKYGEIEDEAVKKITGSIDAPGKAIRRFRNDTNPRVAVTVDLLTTGIDVPAIVNIVFMRRVNSRILYEQMLGRATRRCPEIDKQTFRIFDAVGIYEALREFTTMRPVVVNPSITLTQLFEELVRVEDDEHRKLIRDQILVKLRRKLGRLTDEATEQYTSAAGESPADTLSRVSEANLDDLKTWAKARPTIGPILDWEFGEKRGIPIPVSHHPDEHRETVRGYGKGERPEEYLTAFAAFVNDNENKIEALQIVTRRPRELTRTALRELAIALDAAGYSEAALRAALRDTKNEDIAANLVGFVRQAALGDALVPWSTRVERAIAKMLKAQKWTSPQRQWLERIGRRVMELGVADRTALDEEQFRVAGGFARINKVFDGRLEAILGDINDAAWQETG
jgi:type I restriction enzyme R subunit